MAKRKKKTIKLPEPTTRQYNVEAQIWGFMPVGVHEGTGVTEADRRLDAECKVIGTVDPPELCEGCRKLFTDLEVMNAKADEVRLVLEELDE